MDAEVFLDEDGKMGLFCPYLNETYQIRKFLTFLNQHFPAASSGPRSNEGTGKNCHRCLGGRSSALKIGYLSTVRHHFSYEDALFGVYLIFKQSHILMFYDTRLEFK